MTGPEQDRLEQLLGDDAECRRVYLQYVDMHAGLAVHPEFRGSDWREDLADRDRLRPGPRRISHAVGYALVAAASVAASVAIQLLRWHPGRREPAAQIIARPPAVAASGAPAPKRTLPAYVATLSKTSACTWEGAGPDESRRAGSRLAELRLESGASARLLRGKVVTRSDGTAIPFELHTPDSTLDDLGAEYAVCVEPEGEEVHVFDGEVRRRPAAAPGPRPGGAEDLTAGEARRYGPSPDSTGEPTALDPSRFVRRLDDPGPSSDEGRAGLLAYEGFDYDRAHRLRAGTAAGRIGWATPWHFDFARPLNEGGQGQTTLDVAAGLSRKDAPVAPSAAASTTPGSPSRTAGSPARSGSTRTRSITSVSSSAGRGRRPTRSTRSRCCFAPTTSCATAPRTRGCG